MYKIKLTILVISVFIIYGCKPSQQHIVIKQIPSNTSILLLRDTIKNQIDDIVVWYDFEIYKTCSQKIEISTAPFYYGYNEFSRLRGGSQIKYLLENNKISLFYGNHEQMITLYYRKPRIYRIETWQFIDSNAYIKSKGDRPKPFSYTEQKQFLKPYLDSMNKLHLDTLRIGSIAEVLRTNPKFFDYFIKGDSVFIDFYNKQTGIIRKYLPIEIK